MNKLTYLAGGSKGLGLQMQQIFQHNGHQVIEFSRTGQGDNHVTCDFNHHDKVAVKFSEAFKAYSTANKTHINLIINTATLAPFGALGVADAEIITQHLNININSLVLLIQNFMAFHQPHTAKKSLTFISSGAARRAIPGLAMYSASKAFFERLIDTLAEEQNYQTHPVKCLIINPGVMDTGMQVEIRQQNPVDFPMVDMWTELHETNQLADPKDIAEVCFNLINDAGENGSYYTAQEYHQAD